MNFATLFDYNYLSRGVVLIDSIIQCSDKYNIYILCLDELTFKYLNDKYTNNKYINPIRLADLEEYDSQLLNCKSNRSIVEYYFTLSPCLPIFLLKKFNLTHICTLDADIKFYSSPKRYFEYLNHYSIIITPHNFSKEIKHLEKFGKYNVSFQIFKNDDISLTCLTQWRKSCIEWCKDELDEKHDRFADQKYLDNWDFVYMGYVKVLKEENSGIAPWNLNNSYIKKVNSVFYINNEILIFYHFHHFKQLSERFFSNGFSLYKVKYHNSIGNLYESYAHDLSIVNSEIIYKAKSLRYNTSNKLILKIINEKSIFLKLNNKFFNLNLEFIPDLVVQLINKLYA